jgi:hypothetical protein
MPHHPNTTKENIPSLVKSQKKWRVQKELAQIASRLLLVEKFCGKELILEAD